MGNIGGFWIYTPIEDEPLLCVSLKNRHREQILTENETRK